jgi:hypothetical protein
VNKQEEGKVSYLIDYLHQTIMGALVENEIMNQDEMVMFGAALTHEWLEYVNEVMFDDEQDAKQYLKQVMEAR